jgi:hypothetical protein
MNVTGAELTPSPVFTVMLAFPTAVTKLLGISVRRLNTPVMESQLTLVPRLTPFHWTVGKGADGGIAAKPVPSTNRVKSALPTFRSLGVMAVITGSATASRVSDKTNARANTEKTRGL